MKSETKERLIAGGKLLSLLAILQGFIIVVFARFFPHNLLGDILAGILIGGGITIIYLMEAKFSFRNVEEKEEEIICPDCVDKIIDGKCWCSDKRPR